MPVTKVEFIATSKGKRYIFVENCAIGKRKVSYTVRLEGSPYNDAKPISAKMFNKYKKYALKPEGATV